MSPELKACPFCGRTDTLDPNDRFGGPKPFAVCCWGTTDELSGCCFVGPEAATKAAAIAAWNHRPNERTHAEEAVIRAAVAVCAEETTYTFTSMQNAVEALLAAQPERWRK